MSVASHLQIRLDEYDHKIRTFIPGYDDLVDSAARALLALDRPAPVVVDLGTGTGALAAECLRVRGDARLVLIDSDPDILAMARQRLGGHGGDVAAIAGDFAEIALPACDAVVASLSLHHIRTAAAKRALYRKCGAALRAGGLLVSADCCPSADPGLATLEHGLWRAHLESSYSPEETAGYFAAWAEEDVYMSLPEELGLLRDAGFAPNVVWRQGPMTVIAARWRGLPSGE